MNDREWQAARVPATLLAALGDEANDRKLRLFACAYARMGSRLQEFGDVCYDEFYLEGGKRRPEIDVVAARERLLALRRAVPVPSKGSANVSHERFEFSGEPPQGELGRQAIELAERFADGQATAEELDSLRGRLQPEYRRACTGAMYCGPSAHRPSEEYETLLAAIAPTGRDAAKQAVASVGHFFVAVADSGPRRALNAELRTPLREQTFRLQCDLLREIFGSPFLPPASVSRLEPDVVAVARSIYERRAYDELPILADALADAGGVSDEIVAHLAGPGPHVRGCWALDRVLESATT